MTTEQFSQFAIKVMEEFKLTQIEVYLLELIPLIEMIWADGERQPAELEILNKYIEQMERKFELLELSDIITTRDIHHFIDRYTRQRPDPKLLSAMRNAAIELSIIRGDEETQRDLFSYCIDIAGACVTAYPYQYKDRIMQQEKTLLFTLINALNLSSEPSAQ